MPVDILNFVRKWQQSSLTERSAYQQHFRDLCEALGVPHPTEQDTDGSSYTFEKHVPKTGTDDKGYADVWKRGYFGWEYKSKGGDLKKAYRQLNEYQEALLNPPLGVVCDFDRFEVHTRFENLPPRVYAFTLEDLLNPERDTPTSAIPPLEVLRHTFGDFNELRPDRTAARVTEAAAADFLRLAQQLELERATDPLPFTKEQIAHFLMRLVFCLFADSIGLIKNHAFRKLVTNQRFSPINFNKILPTLFEAMSAEGGFFGPDNIPYFNGGLFTDNTVIPLNPADLAILHSAARHDWSHIEPSIFGTLFERSLDAAKRSLIGAHYTSPDDIKLLVEPVVMQPLYRRWVEVQEAVLAALEEEGASAKSKAPKLNLNRPALEVLQNWATELSSVRVLDPACGSGNFLYIALKRLLDLWHEARIFAIHHGLTLAVDPMPSPEQLFGIETDFYAHEIASVVVWIGFLQWKHDHGVEDLKTPLLRKLENIRQGDAVIRFHESEKSDEHPFGRPYEPTWPEVDYIVGNPPFLGGQDMQGELGEQYTSELRQLYKDRVPGSADLVLFWFEKARALIETHQILRAGLIGTQAIRGGENRKVLEAIKRSGDIFWARSDKKWPKPSKEAGTKKAMVQISMVAFDDGSERTRELDGFPVDEIHPNLRSGVNTTIARRLSENLNLAFQGPVKVGKFEVASKAAEVMKSSPNPHGRSNEEVLRPWMNGNDIKLRPKGRYIIDFGKMTESDAALFESPFEYLKGRVYQKRQDNKDENRKRFWWRLGRSGSDLKRAVHHLSRFAITTRHSKHRIFLWADANLLPDSALVAIARADDYFFGVLHSRIHEIWARAQGTQVRDAESGFRYTPKSTFDTFPFPWPPDKEPKDDPRVEAIAAAARELVRLRDNWLTPPDVPESELKRRTLTNLYTERPTWLDNLHRTLDEAVFAAYGWSADLTDEQILERLLALNHERSANQ